MPFKLPICTFDAKTGILCANCGSRLRKGEISEADVEASKALVKVSERLPEIGRVTLKRAYEARSAYVLEFEPQDVGVVRGSESAIEMLESELGGKVWAVGAGGSERKFLEDVFFPSKVLTVNTVWLPDGGKKTKVIVPARRSDRRLGMFVDLREAVKRARGIELLVETEREAKLRPY